MTDPTTPAPKRAKILYYVPDGWRAHPIHSHYCFSDTMRPEGAVFNCRTGKFSNGSYAGDFQIISINGKRFHHHRLIYESFVGPIPPNCSIKHVDNKTHNNALINLRLVTRTERITYNNSKTMYNVPDGWRAHPIHTNYCFSDTMHEEGSVFKRLTGKFYHGSIQDGYRHISIGYKSVAHHRLIFETFVGPIPQDRSIDHMDRNPLNNSLDNLRLATDSEQVKNRAPFVINGLRRAIIATNRIEQYSIRFNSVTEASMSLNISQKTISGCLSGRLKQTQRYYFVYDISTTTPLASDELVAIISPKRRITNYGRYQQLRRSEWFDITTKPANNGYKYIHYLKSNVALHILVNKFFNDLPPDQSGDIDHIDGNKLNNNATNLKWLTKQEHGLKTRGKAVEIHGVCYVTQTEAARALNITQATVSKRILRKLPGYRVV